MDKSKIVTIVAAVLGLIGVFFLVRIIMAGSDAIETDSALQGSIVDPMIKFSTYLLIATALIAVVFSILNIVKHPESLKKTLITFGIFIGLFLLAYFTAGDELATDAQGKAVEIKDMSDKILTGDAAHALTKKVTALINFTGILGLIGLLVIGWGFVKSLGK
ncbi:hypothetical protein UMM65_12220 [Aureibaculum sp. 2210JD6-5]|uniref:hypothetical protein n=1 Tax=Aureibaculum sp. 2210JD6-5 TaxID=3103957 RepID=UPI002AAE37A7|nr:hypothetical protein [Aureibaculum sp. 2210JD6-5]MDY7396013.1 hypothetical protein [Aureibaculum sp. 2210JD6-5]